MYIPDKPPAPETVIATQQSGTGETWSELAGGAQCADHTQHSAASGPLPVASRTCEYRLGDVPTAAALNIGAKNTADADDPLRLVPDPGVIYETARLAARARWHLEQTGNSAEPQADTQAEIEDNSRPEQWRLHGGAIVSIADPSPEALEVLIHTRRGLC